VPRAALNTALVEVQAPVRLKKPAELAVEFDRIRPIHRAVEVGSVDAIISVAQLRPPSLTPSRASGRR